MIGILTNTKEHKIRSDGIKLDKLFKNVAQWHGSIRETMNATEERIIYQYPALQRTKTKSLIEQCFFISQDRFELSFHKMGGHHRKSKTEKVAWKQKKSAQYLDNGV